MALFKKKQNVAPAGRNPRVPSESRGAVFSYYSHRSGADGYSDHQSGGQAAAAHLSRWRYLPSYLALLGLIISAGYVLSVDIRPRITIKDNQSGILRNEQVYQEAGEALLGGSILNRSKITIDTLSISRRMAEQFPEVDAAVVTLPLMSRRPVISLIPAKPALVLTAGNGRYVLDDKGRAILSGSQAGSSRALADLPQVADESGLEVEVGKGVLPKQSIDFIGGLLTQFDNKGLGVASLTLPALADELHVRIKGQPYFVKFNTSSDPRTAAGTFLAVKERLEKDGQVPREYIDVRVEERAYYK